MDNVKVSRAFPGPEWSRISPDEAGLDDQGLEELRVGLYEESGERPFRVLIVRHGYLVAEWEKALSAEEQRPLASAAKPVFGSILGIAVGEGKIPTADAKVVAYYPEMMDVPEGLGPKPRRHAFPKDREITFRQLISNTSGYMKPGERPGKVFHYQTFGMNILTHALGTIYGVYDTKDPGDKPGFAKLIDRYIKGPVRGSWDYAYMNFEHPSGAHTEIFGNYCQMLINARDMARLGLLWLNWGRWEKQQLIPGDWMREAASVAPMIVQNCSEEQWCYGHGFWTNERGVLWPDLPKDAFAALGAGGQLIWMCPSLDLVVVEGPGLHPGYADDEAFHQVLSAVHRAVVS